MPEAQVEECCLQPSILKAFILNKALLLRLGFGEIRARAHLYSWLGIQRLGCSREEPSRLL